MTLDQPAFIAIVAILCFAALVIFCIGARDE